MSDNKIAENSSEIQFRDLGTIDYMQAYNLQQECVQKVLAGGLQTVLLCEHPAVLTMGRLAKESNLIADKKELEDRGIEVFPMDRGGDITLHSPGQLIMYSIMDLTLLGKDLKNYCTKLEQVAIDLLFEFGILANRISGKTGVWVQTKKIVSLGIGVKKWITFHGLGINVNTDLNLFSLIRPCGMDVSMTSLSEQLGHSVCMSTVKNKLKDSFLKNFNLYQKES